MKHQTHGDRWSAIFDKEEDTMRCMTSITEESEFVCGMKTSYKGRNREYTSTPVYMIRRTEGAGAIKALVYVDEDENTKTIESIFPSAEYLDCCPAERMPYSVEQWNDRIEGWITARPKMEFGPSLTFYCENYLKNKHLLRLADSAEFRLTAFALNCRFPRENEMSFSFEGQKALDWYAKLGQEPKLDANGEVEPVNFSMERLVSFAQMEEEFPDIAQFRSPVSDVEETSVLGVPMYRMKITVARENDHEVYATLYVRKDMLERKPVDGDSLLGTLCLQGEVISDLSKEIGEKDPGNVFSSARDRFLKAINDTDLRNYDDLMPLISPFENLKVRDGYVLDGFWEDLGDEFHTRLYFSAKGSEWRYLPEMVDGKPVPDFDDRMFIHNHLDSKLAAGVPPLSDYIEGEFNEQAIFEAYLLMSAKHFLPHTKGLKDFYRVLLLRKIDFGLLPDETLGAYSNDERVVPSMNIVDGRKAIVSCPFWNEVDGLCVEKTPVTKTETGYQFGTPRVIRII